MTARIFITAFIAGSLLFACEKKVTCTDNDNKDVKGKWTLTETLFDPGDGSGTWRPVAAANAGMYVEFKDNGVFSSSAMLLDNFDHYERTSDSTLLLTKTGNSNNTMVSYYTISGSQLTMSLQCIEACRLKFNRSH